MIVKPSMRSGSSRKALFYYRKWSGFPPGGPEVVGRSS